MFAALTRAREAGARFQRALTPTDLHRPAGGRCGCWPTSTFLFGGIVGRRFSGRTMGARAIGADADVGFAWSGGGDGAGAGRARGGTGSSATIAKFCSTDSAGGRVYLTCCPYTRARGGADFQASSEADRPAPAGWSGLRRNFCLAEFVVRRFGGGRWSSGSAPMLSASPGRAAAMVPAPVERSQLRGHRQRSPNSAGGGLRAREAAPISGEL